MSRFKKIHILRHYIGPHNLPHIDVYEARI